MRYPFRKGYAMAWQAKLRKKEVGKSVYWSTKAGDNRYLGHVEEVPRENAKRRFTNPLFRLQD